MQNVKNIKIKTMPWLMLLLLFTTAPSFAQRFVDWTTFSHGLILTGSYAAGTTTFPVRVEVIGVGNQLNVYTPSEYVQNLETTVSTQTFQTAGPHVGNSKDLRLNFDPDNTGVRVIVRSLYVADIDRSDTWNDTFTLNTDFEDSMLENCNNFTDRGVAGGIDIGQNAEFASWSNSDIMSGFTIDYRTTDGLTTDYLAYSIVVSVVPRFEGILSVCPGSIGLLPTTDSYGISGSWLLTTSAGGQFAVFTPGEDQGTDVRVRIPVTELSEDDPRCCPVTTTLSSTNNDVLSGTANREAQETIFASNFINTGARAVYHAGHFVEMNPGFEAQSGAEFAAYVAGCDGTVTYKSNSQGSRPTTSYKDISSKPLQQVARSKPVVISPNPSNGLFKISVENNTINHIQVTYLDGRIIFNAAANSDRYEIDAAGFPKGIYIINIDTPKGRFSEKFIKN